MCTSTFRAERARYASLTRSRSADDPELMQARRLMQEHGLIIAVSRVLAKSTPITPRCASASSLCCRAMRTWRELHLFHCTSHRAHEGSFRTLAQEQIRAGRFPARKWGGTG